MLIEYMCDVSKLLTVQNPRKWSLKKKLKKRLNTEFPMLRENWTTFSITVNKYFLPLQSKLFVKLKAVSHFILQNWEAIDHPVSEIKIIMIVMWRFRINTREYYGSSCGTLWHRKEWRIRLWVFKIFMDGIVYGF